jgi:hypothetical protein
MRAAASGAVTCRMPAAGRGAAGTPAAGSGQSGSRRSIRKVSRRPVSAHRSRSGRVAMRVSWQRTFIGVLALVVAACGTTRLRSTWVDERDPGTPVGKLAVMVFHEDDNLRRFAEDQAARRLSGKTVAVQGYRLFEQPEKDVQRVRARLAGEGFDGILMARTVSVDTTREYVPPRTVTVPTGPVFVGPFFHPHRLDAYYTQVWGYAYQTTPGYTAQVTTVAIESVLYRLPEGNPVWSAVSEARNPQSQAALVEELVELVGRELAGRGLLGR